MLLPATSFPSGRAAAPARRWPRMRPGALGRGKRVDDYGSALQIPVPNRQQLDRPQPKPDALEPWLHTPQHPGSLMHLQALVGCPPLPPPCWPDAAA